MARTKRLPSGSVYLRGNIYWIKYYVPGLTKPKRISSGTGDAEAAKALLRQKMARAAVHQQHVEDPDRVTISQLLDLLIEDYKYEERASATDTEQRVEKHLRPHFGHIKARDLGTSQLKGYVKMRLGSGDAQATVNKELAFLRRAFRLGHRHEPRLVLTVPHFPIREVDNAREGILTDAQYQRVRKHLADFPYARIALVVAYHTGARKGEISKIRVDKVDLPGREIELARKTVKGTTRTRKARNLPIYGDMIEELEAYLKECDPACPWLIQRYGKQVSDFEKVWAKACSAAGVPNALFHDLRRTAVTQMIDSGFSESEAMSISGHKTHKIFERYNIHSRERTAKLGERLEKAQKERRKPKLVDKAS